MANHLYNVGMMKLLDFVYDWEDSATDIGVMLCKSTLAFDATDLTVADLDPANQETTGSGYVRKPVAASVRHTTKDDANDAIVMSIDNDSVVWTSMTAGANLKVVLFIIDGGAIGDPLAASTHTLFAFIDSGTGFPIDGSTGATLTLNFNSAGVVKATSDPVP